MSQVADHDLAKLYEVYEKARANAFCRACAYEKIKAEDAEYIDFLALKQKKMLMSGPYVLGNLALSVLFHVKGLNRYTNTRSNYIILPVYYAAVFAISNVIISYKVYDEELSTIISSLSKKYEPELLEFDPTLRTLRDNYYIQRT